jgi:hypothetical protein
MLDVFLYLVLYAFVAIGLHDPCLAAPFGSGSAVQSALRDVQGNVGILSGDSIISEAFGGCKGKVVRISRALHALPAIGLFCAHNNSLSKTGFGR